MEENEIIKFQNYFGVISNKRIILTAKKGSEDIPYKQISHVTFRRKNNVPFAIVLGITGIGLIVAALYPESRFSDSASLFVIGLGLLFGFAGLAWLIGHHEIIVGVAGRDRNPIKVELAKTREGTEFVKALRKAIVS